MHIAVETSHVIIFLFCTVGYLFNSIYYLRKISVLNWFEFRNVEYIEKE